MNGEFVDIRPHIWDKVAKVTNFVDRNMNRILRALSQSEKRRAWDDTGGSGGGVTSYRVQILKRKYVAPGYWAYYFVQVDYTPETQLVEPTTNGIGSAAAQLGQATTIDGDIADLDEPTPGIVLVPDHDNNLTFSWDAIGGATNYQLILSSEADGAGTVYYTNTAGSTSRTVDNGDLPGDGSIVYCKLGTEIDSAYTYNLYRFYDAASVIHLAFNQAEITNFDIDSADGVLGNDLDTRDGLLSNGGLIVVPIGGPPYPWLIPSGETDLGWSVPGNQAVLEIHRGDGGYWEFREPNTLGGDCYIASASKIYFPDVGVISSPSPDGTLASTSPTFAWASTTTALEYYIAIGSEPGDGSYDSENRGTNTSFDSTGLPDDGRVVYVTLYTRIDEHPYWFANVFKYTAYTA